MTGTTPVAGALYLCTTLHQTTRVCRYGFHRKRDPESWGKPPASGNKSVVWQGWRDHKSGRFIRDEEILSFVEITPGSQTQAKN